MTTQRASATEPGGAARRTGRRCRCCNRGTVEVFHRVPGVPVSNSLLLDSAEEARAVPTGDLELGVCPRCGFIQNAAFDPSLVSYGEGYEDTQAHSPLWLDFAEETSRRLVADHRLTGGRIVEIGCGKGDFLRLITHVAGGTGVGYDPAVGPGALDGTDAAVTLVAEHYTGSTDESPDLVVCRHTLEHVPDVADFVRMVADSLGQRDTVVFFEVPDTLRILREGAFWDLYYEHCSYFTESTLGWLFESQGFEVVRQETAFDGQYLLIEARPWARRSPAPADLRPQTVVAETKAFATRVELVRNQWRSRTIDRKADGGTVVIWGAGSKAVGFLAATGTGESIDAVVDINPRKHGRYLPATAHRVVAPDDLVELGPDVVIAMNPVYVEEISRDLGDLGIDAEVVAL